MRAHLRILAHWRKGLWRQSPYVQWLKNQVCNLVVEINKDLNHEERVSDEVVRHFGHIYQELALLIAEVFPSDIGFFPPLLGPTVIEGGFAASMVSGLKQWALQKNLMNRDRPMEVNQGLKSILGTCAMWCDSHKSDWVDVFYKAQYNDDNNSAHDALNNILKLFEENPVEANKLNTAVMRQRMEEILNALLDGNTELGVPGPFAGDNTLAELRDHIAKGRPGFRL